MPVARVARSLRSMPRWCAPWAWWLPAFGLAFFLSLFASDARGGGEIGGVHILPFVDVVTEGDTINVRVRGFRYGQSRSKTFNMRYRVEDDDNLDLLDARQEGIKRRQFNAEPRRGQPSSEVFVAALNHASTTLKIRTRPDAKCGDGHITVTLLSTYNNNLPYHIAPHPQYGSASLRIPVRDDGKCPVISIDPGPALERDGVTEGGTFDFTLKRVSPKINDRKVRLNWEVVDASSRDFLPGAEEGRKFHDLPVYTIGDGGALGAKHDARVQTQIDPRSGGGTVTVKLLNSEYYKLGAKTTLTVPVKDDAGYATRVLRDQDITVAENELEVLVGSFIHTGFWLPVFLEGGIATSAEDPSVRVTFVESGGDCKATANAQDLAKWASGTGYTPRTDFPEPQVISWDVSRPDFRGGRLWHFLMDDDYYESDETLCVRFDQPRYLKLPNGAKEHFATVTIKSDDPPPAIEVDSPSAAEGDGTLDFTVTLTNPPQGKAVTLRYRDAGDGDAISGDDYNPVAKDTLTFPADAGDEPQKKAVQVRLIDDKEIEDDETVRLRFSRVENADFKDSARGVTVRGIITDNDTHKVYLRLREAAPGAGPVAVQEGGTAVFHVDILVYEDGKWQVGSLDNKIDVGWRVRGDNESPGFTRSDYSGSAGNKATIPAGKTGAKLEVLTVSDGQEESIETFVVELYYAIDLVEGIPLDYGKSAARGAIYDGPTLRIAAPKGPATEGNRLRFPVSLGVAHDADISVAWKTESLAAHTAEAGKDYVAASGTLVFKAGEIDRTIRVKTLQDDIDEPSEDFSVVLDDPKVAGLDMGPPRATGIIRDDDKRPAIAIGDATVTEGGTLTLPITLNPAPAIPVRLEWRVRAPSVHGATHGVDYTGAASGEITIAAGQSRTNLAFPTIDDAVDEPTETFEVALVVLPKEPPKEEPLFFTSRRSEQQADMLAPLTATATILDNDAVRLSIDDVEVKEGGKNAVFTVRLSSPRTYPVEVEFRTKDGGGPTVQVEEDSFFDPKKIGTIALGAAGPFQDYEGIATPRTVRFAPGETEARLPPIQVLDDKITEHSEYFQGIISFKPGTADPNAIIAKAVGLATIRDNDSTRYWITNRHTTVREGKSIRIRVKRDRTDFRATGLYGCIQPTAARGTDGHATLKIEGISNDQVDAYIESVSNPASVCSNRQNDSSVPARFSFDEGEDEASFWVHTVDDDREESDETFAAYIHPGTAHGGNEGASSAKPTDFFKARTVFTILDDDNIHRFRVVSANSPWEGEEAHFDIYADSDAGLAVLKKDSNPVVFIKHGADNDTAVGGKHYKPKTNAVFLGDLSSVTDRSQRVGRVSVPTTQDEVLDGNKTLTVSITEITGAGFSSSLFRPAHGGGSATATIRDDEAIYLSLADAVGDEGDTAAVEVRLSKAVERDITVRFRIKEGTATAPEDFTVCSPGDAGCALVIPAGKTEAQFRVPTTEDVVPEETEKFRVVIDEVDYANLIIEDRVAVVSIRDDDARSVAIAGLADASTPENNVWTSPVPAWEGSPDGGVAWTIEGTDAARFTIDPDTGVVTLPAQDFEAPADADGDNVYDARVRVTDEDGNTAAVALSVTVNDLAVTVSPATLTLTEADDSETVDAKENVGTYEVVLEHRPSGPVTVAIAGADAAIATADADADTGGDQATLTFTTANWDDLQTVAVTAVGDDIDNAGDRRAVTLTHAVSGADYASETAGSVIVTVTDDDEARLSVADAEAAEGGTATFRVELSTPSETQVTVTATTSEGSATDPEDYTHKTETLTFAAGDTSKAFTVAIASDSVAELDETFTVTLSGATGAAIADATATGTISGADALLSIGDITAAEGDPLTFTVTRTGDTSGSASVQWGTSDDTAEGATQATAGTDYTVAATAQTLAFKAGDSTATFTVATIEDTRDEHDESFRVLLSAPSEGVVIADGTAIGTIEDDDGAPSVSVGDAAAVAEGADKTTADMTFKVTLSAASGKDVTVPYALDGTAAAGTDYTPPNPLTVTIAAGQTEASIVIKVKGDAVNEPDETIEVALKKPTNADIGSAEGAGEASGTITDDDDAAVTLKLAPAKIGEKGGTSTVTAALDVAASEAVTVTVSASGEAAALSQQKVLTIAKGATASTGAVTLTAVDNDKDEDDRQVEVSATASGGREIANPAPVTLTVEDDDGAPSVSVGDAAAVAEGADKTTADMTFKVTLSAASGKDVTVPYALDGTAAAGTDYTPPNPLTVTIAAGQTEASIVIKVKGDAVNEPDETIEVALKKPTNADIGSAEGAGEASGTITDDDDAAVTLKLAPAKIGEKGGTSTVTAALDVAASEAVTVTVSASGEAAALSQQKVLTIAKGATASTGAVTLTAVDNDKDEDDRQVEVSATASGGREIANPAPVTLTVEDDDGAPSVSVGDAAAVAEGADKTTADMTFKVTLSAASGKDVTVPYALDGTAAAGTDYTPPNPLTVTIAAGQTEASIVIKVKGDAVNEPDETIEVALKKPTNADIGSAEGAGEASGTITDDDDAAVTLKLAPAKIGEKGGTSTVTAALDVAASEAVTVTVSASGEAAALSQQKVLTIAKGATASTGAVTLTAVDNDKDEDDRQVEVSATASGGREIANPAPVTLTVEDDDGAPSVSVGDAAAVAEGADKTTADMTFKVTLSAASGKDVTVPYALDGTAAAGTDYTPPNPLTVTIAAGQTEASIVIKVKGDAVNEPDETIEVALKKPTNADIGSAEGAGEASGTITDDDDAAVTLKLAPAKIGEKGGTSTVTAALDVAASEAVTVTVSASGEAAALSQQKVLTIAKGATASTGAVTLTAVDNDKDEDDRQVEVSATASGGREIANPAPVTLTVEDDDGAPSVSVGDAAAVAEGADKTTADMTFKVTLSAASGKDVTVPYALDGTAAAGTDYTPPNPLTVTIAAGQTEASIVIKVKGDAVNEPDETIEVALKKPTNADIGSAEGAGEASGTITDDDDAAVTLKLAPAKIGEKGGTSTVTAALDVAASEAVTVTVSASGEAAALSQQKVLTIAKGATASTGAVTLTAVDNDKDEDDRQVEVSATASGGREIANPAPVTLTVEDDDGAPSVSVGDAAAVAEGADKTTADMTFKVTLSAASGKDVTVPYALDGTAAAGTDYTPPNPLTVTIAAGQTEASIVIKVKGDAVNEPDETIEVALKKPTNADIGSAEGAGEASGTITDDDDAAVTLKLAPAKIGEKGGTSTVTAALDVAASEAVTVTVSASGEAAALSQQKVLTIAKGATASTGAVTLTAVDNDKDEDDRQVEVSATASGGREIANPAPVTLTVEDDDGAPSVSVGDAAAVAEGADKTTADMTFKVTLSAASGKDVTVPYALDGTAAAGTDYTPPNPLTVTIAAGQTEASIVIKVKGDAVNEPDETIEVALKKPTNADIGSAEGAGEASGTITDDDDAAVTLKLAPAKIGEKGGTSTVTAALDVAASEAVTVTVSASGEAAALSQQKVLTIAKGATASTGAVTLTAVDNDKDEDDRQVEVSATASGGREIANPAPVTLTVEDDDGAPSVSVGDAAAVAEGADKTTADMTFKVTLSAASGKDVTVPYALDGTAAAGTDYTPPNPLTVTIAAGQTEASIVIKVKGDAVNEPDETIEVALKKPTNADIGSAEGAGEASGTITDDDDAAVTLKLAPAKIGEKGGTSTVTAALDVAASEAVTVTVSASGEAAALSQQKVLTIAKGATASTGAVTLTAVDNDKDEDDRQVEVSATASGGREIANPAPVTLTVEDDDGAPSVSVGDAAAVAEGADKTTADMTFKVTLSAASGKDVTVPYALDGTAAAGTDYTPPNPLTVTIAAGQTEASIVIKVKGDAVNEPDETIEVALKKPTNADIGSAEGAGEASGTITDDDDAAVTLKLAPAKIGEKGGTSTVRRAVVVLDRQRHRRRIRDLAPAGRRRRHLDLAVILVLVVVHRRERHRAGARRGALGDGEHLLLAQRRRLARSRHRHRHRLARRDVERRRHRARAALLADLRRRQLQRHRRVVVVGDRAAGLAGALGGTDVGVGRFLERHLDGFVRLVDRVALDLDHDRGFGLPGGDGDRQRIRRRVVCAGGGRAVQRVGHGHILAAGRRQRHLERHVGRRLVGALRHRRRVAHRHARRAVVVLDRQRHRRRIRDLAPAGRRRRHLDLAVILVLVVVHRRERHRAGARRGALGDGEHLLLLSAAASPEADTVTVTASLAATSSAAVTVLVPPFSPIFAGASFSVTAASSSSVIVPLASPAPSAEPMSALVGFLSATSMVSSGSLTASPLTLITIEASVCPAAMVTVSGFGGV